MRVDVEKQRLSPDGYRYLSMGAGRRLPASFHLRFLLPWILGADIVRWVWVSRIALLAMLPAGFVYGLELGWERALFVAAVPLGLSGVWRFSWSHPVLVDPTALCLSVWAGAAAVHGLWPVALALCFVAAGVKEPSPAFVAVFAWSPLYLIAFAVPLVRWLFWERGEDVLDAENAWILDNPLKASWKYHKEHLTDPFLWLTPWGVLLVAFVSPTPIVAVALAVGYAQTVIATDSVRLYQWAWPVLAVATAAVVPVPWLLLVALVHITNPWRGGGV